MVHFPVSLRIFTDKAYIFIPYYYLLHGIANIAGIFLGGASIFKTPVPAASDLSFDLRSIHHIVLDLSIKTI